MLLILGEYSMLSGEITDLRKGKGEYVRIMRIMETVLFFGDLKSG